MRTQKQRGPVRFTIDHDKKRIALVSILGKDKPAKLFVEDYEALIKAGYTDKWVLNDSGNGYCYVRCSATKQLGNTETIARLILGLPRGFQVKYRDHDRLNLRRDNLVLAKRHRKAIPEAAFEFLEKM